MKSASGIMLALAFVLIVTLPGLGQAAKSAGNAQIAHGEYLVRDIGGCADCHTPRDRKGELIIGQWLQGATLDFAPLVPFPGWAPVSPNIAGLSGWDTEKAVQFLMTGLDPAGRRPRPPMPPYRMDRADAEAVVAYLRSLK